MAGTRSCFPLAFADYMRLVLPWIKGGQRDELMKTELVREELIGRIRCALAALLRAAPRLPPGPHAAAPRAALHRRIHSLRVALARAAGPYFPARIRLHPPPLPAAPAAGSAP